MKLETVDYLADDAAQQFVTSLRETGFGVLKNHPIPQELVESIYKKVIRKKDIGPLSGRFSH